MDATQQTSGAPGVALAVAPAQSAAPTPQPPQPPPAHPASTAQDLVPRSYLTTATDQAKRRKEKIRTLKTTLDQAQASLTEVTTERDALREAAEAHQSKLKTVADRMAEAALTAAITSEGLTPDAARLLLPALRAHVSVDPETFEVKVVTEEVKKAAAAIKPPQPKPSSVGGAALHHTITAARTPATSDRPLTAAERLRAEANALQSRR